MTLSELKPQSKQLVYDLVTQAGVDTGDWKNYKRPNSPETNPKYCYEWAFLAQDRVVLCLWFSKMQVDESGVFQLENHRETKIEHREWSTAQKQRAWHMDRAFATAWKKRLPIRVIVVDGPPEQAVGEVERRMLDSEPWHIAAYDPSTGWCRLQRGPWPAPLETFTLEEITDAGTFSEGAQSEATIKTRERSVRLRDLARDYFAAKSDDKRLHCAVCNWASPPALQLTGLIVEIHHGLGISAYPADGRALTFEEAIQHLTPLCPNCHRITHAKLGGGMFALMELRAALLPLAQDSK